LRTTGAAADPRLPRRGAVPCDDVASAIADQRAAVVHGRRRSAASLARVV